MFVRAQLNLLPGYSIIEGARAWLSTLVEYDMKNDQAEVCRYQPKPKDVNTELNNCFSIYFRNEKIINDIFEEAICAVAHSRSFGS